jgi:superfamily I DNA/RNA helicase
MELKNPQNILINSLEGIHLVDAGAGTGKTRTIVKRYQKLIENRVHPQDIFLVTFTNNAADQMKEEVIRKVTGDVIITDLLDAPIMTFHSFCSRLLKKYGTDAPKHLGLSEFLSNNFNIIEDSFFEIEFFKRFYTDFSISVKSKYESVLNSLGNDYQIILKTIKKLCSLGMFPTSEGWRDEDSKKLEGDYEEYYLLFDKMNQKAMGKRGEIQNELCNSFKSASKNVYIDFDKEKVVLGKTINPEIKKELFFDEYQDVLIEFMREVYYEYLKYMLERNLLNYEFMVMFAYVILFYNKTIRERNQFDYIMVDEFQDTDEIQFKLIMLLSKNIQGTANLCVVGDWRQGIYGFRNTTIKNITEFENNLKTFKEELNTGEERIEYDVDDVKEIMFENNYRSSELILNFSRHALFCEGVKKEEVDVDYIEEKFQEPLKPIRELDDLTEINFFEADEKKIEMELILQKISELVNEKKKFKIREFDKETGEVSSEESIQYSDICVLSRTKKFGLELQKEALKKGIPMNYQGGLELFATEQGILVLAWLRLVLNSHSIYGWIPVLEKEGYNYNEIKYFKEKISNTNDKEKKLFDDLPGNLLDFLKYLRSIKENILFVVEAIVKKYDFIDEYANKVIDTIQTWLVSDSISINDLVYIIDNFKTQEFNLEINNTANAIVVHTIHSAKGLEYPVVILADCNSKVFPSTKGESGQLIYNQIIGLRAKKLYGTNGKYYYRFNNWKTDLLSSIVKRSDYDEERRLLYVAVTRAKQYLYFTASKPSPFFENLAERTGNKILEGFGYEIKPLVGEKIAKPIEIKIDKKFKKRKVFISPHTIMEDSELLEEQSDTDNFNENNFSIKYLQEKRKFGIRIHNLAHKIANNIEVKSDLLEVQRIKSFINNIRANEIKSEVEFILPFENEVIRGVIDLLAFYEDRIEIIDYKTDSSQRNIEKYKIQLSVYKEAISKIYPSKKIKCKLFFVSLDKVVDIEPEKFSKIYREVFT